MTLVIDSCVRGDDSATRRYYQAYLKANGIVPAEVLNLEAMDLRPLNRQRLAQRDTLCREKAYDHAIFRLARQFQAASEIVIAAPFWDLSFPAVLKVYLEQIMVSGITFGYDTNGRYHGYCQAKRLLYFSTCGGYVGAGNQGLSYIQALAEMLGIPSVQAYILEGLDTDPDKREAVLAQGIAAFSKKSEMV